MRTIYIILLTSTIILNFPSFAQKDFLPGFIITNNNDTIRGLVNQKSNYQNAKTCEFRKEINSNSEVYSPLELKGYGAGSNRLYVSKEIMINTEKRKVFLEFLVDGIVDLYIYKDKDEEKYYIQKDTSLFELDNSKKETIKDGVTYSQKSKKYIGILTYLFKDSPKLYQQIKNTSYSDNALIKVTRDYHNSVCSEYECIIYKKSNKVDVFFEPNLGFIYSKLSFPETPQFTTDSKPFGGINFRFAPMNLSKWNFLVGISYSNNNFDLKITEFYNVRSVQFLKLRNVNIEYSIIRVPVTVNYLFTFKNFQPFISFGITNTIFINSKFNVERFSKHNLGILLGLGLRYKLNNKSSIFLTSEFEHRFPALASNNTFENYNVQSLAFNIGYSIKINK